MAGKFTNLIYDDGAYNEKVQRSTDGLQYHLDPNYAINCNNCYAPHGPRGGHDNAVASNVGDMIDIDSALRGINRVKSHCVDSQVPQRINTRNFYTPPTCQNGLETQYSRYSHPAYDIRGLTVPDMRFDYPLVDPQCQIFENFAINTRLQAKDNHKAVWQTPMDQQRILPSERSKNVKKCRISINCDYDPPYQYN